ncbi:hypothetical protein O0L34_g14778 [Tuta absoluta]|nr:hypothetical protein O0L34_g14778 [Tuta absoluta]
MEALFLVSCVSLFAIDPVLSVVIKGSSPSGETVIAVSSSNPDFAKHFSLNYPAFGDSSRDLPHVSALARNFYDKLFGRSFSIVGPGHAFAGTGRGLVSANNFYPTFFTPFNFGLNNFDEANWIRNIGDLYNPSQFGSGEVRTVSAVNDNGRVYGEVKTVTVDDKGRSHVVNNVVN